MKSEYMTQGSPLPFARDVFNHYCKKYIGIQT